MLIKIIENNTIVTSSKLKMDCTYLEKMYCDGEESIVEIIVDISNFDPLRSKKWFSLNGCKINFGQN